MRIVCGTDGAEFGVDWARKALAEADIGEEAREQILHGNAAMLGQDRAAPNGHRVIPCARPRARFALT